MSLIRGTPETLGKFELEIVVTEKFVDSIQGIETTIDSLVAKLKELNEMLAKFGSVAIVYKTESEQEDG